MSTRTARGVAASILIAAVSLGVFFAAGELVLRLKNSSMTNYDIEMWRYAKELKRKSADPALDFDHVTSKSAVLQGIDIRLNEWGLRGAAVSPLPAGARRILFLGGSITLGWGVPEAETVQAQLEQRLAAAGEKAQVLNGGVGNYNAERYVARFFKKHAELKPTDIVVQYFLRDAEDLPPGGGNTLLRESQVAVTLWIAYHRLFDKKGEETLVEHYRKAYQPDARGFLVMKAKLKELAEHARANKVRLYLAMTPDVHNLVDYKLGFVHDIMREVSAELGYTYIDLLPAMRGRRPEELFAMPGDPHPNALGHKLMAEAIFPVVSRTVVQAMR